MFTEVELKYQVDGFAETRVKLKKSGAELICGGTEETNTVFDLSDGSLGSAGTLLRLRKFGTEVILTVKEPGVSGAMKIRKEHETVLSISFSAADEMLKALRYVPVFNYEKIREIWSMGDNVHICLDSLYFGNYVEIEADTQLKVSEASIILGLDPGNGLSQSYRKLQYLYDSR